MFPEKLFEAEDVRRIPKDWIQDLKCMTAFDASTYSLGLQNGLVQMQKDPLDYPKHPGSLVEERMESFLSITTNFETAKQAAEAGLFYSGKEKTLICYYCGSTIHDWLPKDDPWQRHVDIRPECPVIKRHGVILPETRSFAYLRRSSSCPNSYSVLVE